MSDYRGVKRIVSGGQTGVDRAALDVALERGVACGGWCPRGRRAEDGVIPPRYPLKETELPRYSERTRRNVRDSDATLLLNLGTFDGGTQYTARVASRMKRPCLIVQLDEPPPMEHVHYWLKRHAVGILNIAGPREGKRSGAYRLARQFLERLLGSEVA